jgi:hypothetical protein
MQRIVCVALAGALALCSWPAIAADVPMLGGKVAKLKNKAGTVSDQALVKFSKDMALSSLPPSPVCPAVSTIRLTSDTGDVLITLDCAHWTASGSRYIYLDPTGSSGGVQKVILVSKSTGGQLLIKARGAHYGMQALPLPIAFLDAQLAIETASYCGRFVSPPSTFKKNESDKVIIKGPSGECIQPTATVTSTETATATSTQTAVDTPTPTATWTATATITATDTATVGPSPTPTFTVPPGSTATATPTLFPADAFRIDSVNLRDPHVFALCIDVTDPNLTGLSANQQIAALLNADGDMDGFLDFNMLALFRPLRQPPLAGTTLDIVTADCTAPAGSETCSPDLSTPQSTAYANQGSGVCLTPLAGTSGPNNTGSYTPAISTPAAPCFNTTPVTISLPFGIFNIPLQNVRAGATYVGGPANSLINGLLSGFLSETDANSILIPMSVPLIGGQAVSSLLPGGTGACAPHTAKDTGPLGQPGWYFYLNFTAHRVTWTGP